MDAEYFELVRERKNSQARSFGHIFAKGAASAKLDRM